VSREEGRSVREGPISSDVIWCESKDFGPGGDFGRGGDRNGGDPAGCAPCPGMNRRSIWAGGRLVKREVWGWGGGGSRLG